MGGCNVFSMALARSSALLLLLAVAVEADDCNGACVVSIVIPTVFALVLLAFIAYYFKTSQTDYSKADDSIGAAPSETPAVPLTEVPVVAPTADPTPDPEAPPEKDVEAAPEAA